MKMALDRRGSALITVLIVASLVAAAALAHHGILQQNAKRSVSRTDTGKALSYAEAGMATVMDRLRLPAPQENFTAPSTLQLSGNMPNGRYDTSALRDPYDASLVRLFSTGYCYLDRGNAVDPTNGKRAQIAVIRASARIRSAAAFFAAVPGTLQIGYGADLSSASIYGAELHFDPPDGVTAEQTSVYQAFYSDSVMPEAPSYVTFTGPAPALKRLPIEPNLIPINSQLRTLYTAWAASDRLSPGASLTGSLGAPSNSYGVYYCPGDLFLAGTSSQSQSLDVNGSVLIYVAGTVTIAGSVRAANSNSWLAVIAENSIRLAAVAPTTMELEGTYLSGQAFLAEPAPAGRAGGKLTFTGGFQAQEGINFSGGWPKRIYIFKAAPSKMLLPFFLGVEDYQVERGAYAS
jgi:hypothetical protein